MEWKTPYRTIWVSQKLRPKTSSSFPGPGLGVGRAHPRAQSFRMAHSLINASTAEAKKVKAERISLQHILSFDLTAYSLWIELFE